MKGVILLMAILSVPPNIDKSFLNLSWEASESKIIMTRTEFISENFSTDSGAPFLFDGREYLLPIYNNKFRYLVLMASRQAEKSSFEVKDMLSDAILNSQVSQ